MKKEIEIIKKNYLIRYYTDKTKTKSKLVNIEYIEKVIKNNTNNTTKGRQAFDRLIKKLINNKNQIFEYRSRKDFKIIFIYR